MQNGLWWSRGGSGGGSWLRGCRSKVKGVPVSYQLAALVMVKIMIVRAAMNTSPTRMKSGISERLLGNNEGSRSASSGGSEISRFVSLGVSSFGLKIARFTMRISL